MIRFSSEAEASPKENDLQQEKVKADAAEAELASIEKKETEATEAKDNVSEMKKAATTYIEGTKSKLEEHAESLEAAKKVKGGCPDCKKDEDEKKDESSEKKKDK